MMSLRLSGVVIAAALLSGCITSGTTHRYASDVETYFQYAASDRDFHVVVVASPQIGTAANVSQKVTAAFQRAHPDVNANFTVQPGPTAISPYKAVIIFNPPTDIRAEAVCRAPQSINPVASSDQLRLYGVFCEDTPISEITLSVDPAPKIDDPIFERALVDLTQQLIPENRDEVKPSGDS